MDVAMIVTSESEKDAASENRTEETTSKTGDSLIGDSDMTQLFPLRKI